MSELDQLFTKIGIKNSASLFFIEDKKWKNIIPYRLQKGLEEINPDAFFVQENKPIILFFDLSSVPRDRNDLFKKIWNLGGLPIVFIVEDTNIDIYNGYSFDTQKALFKNLEIDGRKISEDDFSVWDMFSGNLWKKIPVSKTRVDEELLKNIQSAQTEIIKLGLKDVIASNLIGRLLFSRYLIDRGVKIDEKYFVDNRSFLKLLKSKNKLYLYFDYLKENFNGDLFPVSEEERANVSSEHLEVLFHLFKGDELATGQQSLFNYYDFKIIPVELISEVYQRFMGSEKQKKEGAYYTPSFLVDYVLERTIKKHLRKKKSCKVLDPSCGSGIFLVETLRCMIEKHLLDERRIGIGELKKIAEENIFGIDKDEIAINLSIFSLCLTLLDYVEPKDITKFQLPQLINKNLFIADFFDEKSSFNDRIKDLDFIIGNPPWGSTKRDNSHVAYSKKEEIPISDNQIAQSFITRVKDLSSEKTECALIITSKILYNHNAKDFRKYWLENFFINRILELSSVRNQIFAQVTPPSAIVFYKYANHKDTKNNIVIHTSVKPNIFLKYLRILVIEKNDIKEIQQQYFQKYDWLWKTMLYGNVFDFYLINKLKQSSETVRDFVDESKILFGSGFKRANKKNKIERFSDKYLLQPDQLSPYCHLNQENRLIDKYPDLLFENGGIEGIYKGPSLLLKRTLKESPILTFTDVDFVFPNTIYGIHGQDERPLKILGAYLSSSLAKYLLFLTSTTWGVEREEILQKEYKDLPFLYNRDDEDKLSTAFDSLMEVSVIRNNIESSENQIDKINDLLYKEGGLSEQNKRTIDYGINISIPLFFGDRIPIVSCTKEQMRDYAQIYFNYFNNRWNKKPRYFEIDICFNRYIVGMNFKVVEERKGEGINFTSDSGTLKDLMGLMKLGEKKITDKIYQERDIRGFNETSFYIIKSNQYKNWHPAIADADLSEFIDCMMKAESNSWE